jgi:hypothetical protein
MKGTILLLVGIATALFAACGNPVVDDKIALLGGEAEGVPEGPFHRPGQPCLLCHQEDGPAPAFQIAGTIFAETKSFKTVDKALVILTDAAGQVFTLETNCIGNFFLYADNDKTLQFPVAAEVRYPLFDAEGKIRKDGEGNILRKSKSMASWISRDGSCAGCHSLYGPEKNGTDIDQTYWVYCNAPGDTDVFPDLAPSCQGKLPNDSGSKQ